MPLIRPFRDFSEHEVLNFYALDTSSGTRGQFVTFANGSGWTADDQFQTQPVGASYARTVSNRYAVPGRVTVINTTGGTAAGPLGLLLYDVSETDENGELLIFKPQKAAEMQTVVSGQVVPILTRGVVLYSGVSGIPMAGTNAYCDVNGGLTTFTGANVVGKFLGTKSSQGFVLLKVTL